MIKKSVMYWLALLLLCSYSSVWAEVPADAVWIDVRSPAEYASGHLEQANPIPFDGIEVGVAQLQLSKDTPIYLYCAVGGRAEIAKNRLEALDYTNVVNVGSLEAAEKLAALSHP
jgi:rhodanese-related sulfurtransferase